ncbi:hypothetical protein AB4Y42_35040 [Paraburkholderia sp. EG286B]|uniref:hypothetical protein n=1 Tax=Paraburkholderia sp. EG286B TaxID=3237011 RepID=UPI0034D24FDE
MCIHLCKMREISANLSQSRRCSKIVVEHVFMTCQARMTQFEEKMQARTKLTSAVLLSLVIGGSIIFPTTVNAEGASAVIPMNHPGAGASNLSGPVSLLTNREFFLSIFVLIFGLIALLLQSFLLKKANASAAEASKALILILIVIGVIFSITAGFSAQTVAPAVGLFGTIAGYLLGRREGQEGERQ